MTQTYNNQWSVVKCLWVDTALPHTIAAAFYLLHWPLLSYTAAPCWSIKKNWIHIFILKTSAITEVENILKWFIIHWFYVCLENVFNFKCSQDSSE